MMPVFYGCDSFFVNPSILAGLYGILCLTSIHCQYTLACVIHQDTMRDKSRSYMGCVKLVMRREEATLTPL